MPLDSDKKDKAATTENNFRYTTISVQIPVLKAEGLIPTIRAMTTDVETVALFGRIIMCSFR